MSNVAEQSRAGSLADLVEALEDEIIPKLFLLAQRDPEVLVLLQVVPVASEVAFEEVLMAAGDEEASEEVSRIVEDMAEVEEV
jgi:hypothetical protein